jgi:hypothetical protein
MPLERQLLESLFVETAEFRRETPKGPNKPELRTNDVNDETKPHFPRKIQAVLGFALHLNERIARCEKVPVQRPTTIRRKSEVAGLVRGLESTAQQIYANPNMFRPWHDEISEAHMGSDLEAIEPALFDKVIAEATETKSGLVAAEVRSGYDAKPYIGEA